MVDEMSNGPGNCRPSPPAGTREFDLDPYRGVVCLWLMVMHLCWLSEIHGPLLRLVPDSVPELALHVRLGVESFLVLAGFMAAHMLRPVRGEQVLFRAYFLRRLCRLVLPFAVAVLLAAADKWLAYFLLAGGKGRPDLLDVLAQMFLVNEFVGVPEAASGYWTLAALEQAYLLGLTALAIAYVLVRGRPETAYSRAFAAMGPVALAAFIGSGAVYLLEVPCRISLPSCAYFIALGVLLYGHARLRSYRWELPVAVALLIAASVWTLNSRLAAAMLAVWVLSALARGVRFPGGRLLNGLRFIGQRSYSVYLIHAIVGIRLLSGYKFVAGYGDWVAVPLLVAASTASLIGAMVFYRWVERPCQELARKVQYRDRSLKAEPITIPALQAATS